MFCTKCGAENPSDAAYCMSCGSSLAASTPSPATPAVTPAAVRGSIVSRMIRAAKLDVALYEEVEADKTATTQALQVVVIASVASGIGTALGSMLTAGIGAAMGVGLLIGGVVVALFGWLVWSFITYFIGTRVFKGTATYGELLRVIGFSDSPGVLRILSFIPVLGVLIIIGTAVWTLIAMVIAVRQALDFTTGKAILTCIVGWIVLVAITVLLGFAIMSSFTGF